MSNLATHRTVFTVNGRPTELAVEARRTLAEVLRAECGLTGTKIGCEQGACGACTVLFDGKQIRSCLLFAVQAHGADIWTIEGLSSSPGRDGQTAVPLPRLRDLAHAFKRNHALQCGFCTPGMLIAAAALGHDTEDASDHNTEGVLNEAQIREGLSGNICRCTGYQAIVRSVVETFGSAHERRS